MNELIKEALIEEGEEPTEENIEEIEKELDTINSINFNDIEFIGFNEVTKEYFIVVDKVVVYRNTNKRFLFRHIEKEFEYTRTQGFKNGEKEYEVEE